MEDLMEQIRRENWAYRKTDKPIVSDAEYDIHLSTLAEQMTEDEFDAFLESLMEDAGDVGIGDYVVGSLKKIKYENQELLVKMAQMKILDWVFASAKIDGLSFVATYRFVGNGIAKYNSCSNRGDAAGGTDWTEKGRYILPAEIKSDRDVDVRGEFTLTEDSHKILGFKNRRNGTSGIMGSGDVEPEKLKYVKAFAYQILNPKSGRELIKDQFADLEKLGFVVAAYMMVRIDDNLEEELKELYLGWAKALPYDIDGLVLSSSHWKNENDKFYPTGKIAYKINSEGVPVAWTGIRWTLTKGRIYYPTYLLVPTEIDGVTVSKATANNTRMLMNMNLCYDDKLAVIRSGKVIPKVIGLIVGETGRDPYVFPTHCPECGTEFGWNQVLDTKTKKLVDGAHLMCPNVFCGEVKRVEAFVKALDIENVSEKRLREFGILTFDALLDFVPNRKAKMQVAFYEDLLKKMFNRSQKDLLRSMKFDGFGTRSFDKLFEHCGKSLGGMNDLFLLVAGGELPVMPADIGYRTIEKATEDWHMNGKVLESIITDPRYREPEEVEEAQKGTALSGTFLFTGSFAIHARKDLEKMVPANGGTLSSSVSKNLNYLVVGDGGGSKQDKAEALGTVKIIDEKTFLAMLS